jgi:voltage-gated potassium channel
MERPLIVAAVVFLLALCIPVIEPHLNAVARGAVDVANVAIWAFFAVDYLVRLRLAPDRRTFVRKHIVDLVVVIVPFFRPLRLLRLFSVTGLLARRGRGGLVKDVTVYVCVASVVVVFLGAVGVLDLERHAHDARITTFPDALWFACSTMTAVPYGDVFPVTQGGRLVAVALMIAGLVLVGIITAAIAAWLVEFVSGDAEIEAGIEEIEDAVAIEQGELQQILARLASIESHLLAQSPAS